MTARKRKIKMRFKGISYGSVEDLLTHADKISRKIQVREKAIKLRPLSVFERRVLRLAPRFLAGQYQRKKMALHLLKRGGVYTPSEVQLREMSRKVSMAMTLLRRRSLIRLTTKRDRPTSVLKLREAMPEEVENHMGLVNAVLSRGHKFLASDWRRFLSFEQAREIGRIGLARGIETHDPAKGALSTHACNRIASEVAKEVKRLRRFASLEVSLEAKPSQDSRSPEEKLGTPSPDPEVFQNKLQVLLRKKRRLATHHVLVWTLNHVFGHSFTDIGKHFGVSRQAVHFLVKKADKELQRA